MTRRRNERPCEHFACTPCANAGRRYGVERIQWHADQNAARFRRAGGWITMAAGLVIVVAALAWAPAWWAMLPGLAMGVGALWAGWRWAR